MSLSKSELRKQMRRKRQQLPTAQRHQHSLELCDNLNRLEAIIRAPRIAVYLAYDGELSLDAFIADCWHKGKETCLPALHPVGYNKLWFMPFRRKTLMTNNKYGISEPVGLYKDALPLFMLNVILMPLVAFDNKGNRLGMGGGFYDRTLAAAKARTHRQAPILIGIAYDHQQVDTLTTEPWDISLDAIVTPSRIIQWD